MKAGFRRKMIFPMKKNDVVFQRSVEKSQIGELPLKSFQGQIHLVDNSRQFRQIKPLIAEVSAFGFDTETKPSFRKGKVNRVALLQLATHEHAFLFRISQTGIPDFIKNILEDARIIKIGVAIHDDLKSLNKIRPVHHAGFIDLQQYVGRFKIEDKSLKKITANILGFRISKRYQTSNWEADSLSLQQLEYAATDAWVCHEIYQRLILLDSQ
jgi:ribonuclease D